MAVTKEQSDEALKILGLDSKATPQHIKKAYHLLALKHHPDKGGDEEMFKKIDDAYKILLEKVDDKKTSLEDIMKDMGFLLYLHAYCIEAQAHFASPSLNKQLDSHMSGFFHQRNIPILKSLISMVEKIIAGEAESKNVPKVLLQKAKYNSSNKNYILDNKYTLNANNYTESELIWLYAMLSSGKVIINGTFCFNNIKHAINNQKLLVDLLNSQLVFTNKASSYAKEQANFENPKSLANFMRTHYYNISLAIEISSYALLVPMVFMFNLSPLANILVLLLGCLASYYAVKYSMHYFYQIFTHTTTSLFITVAKDWLGKTTQSTKDEMESSFAAQKQTDENDIKPRSESVGEKVCHMWSAMWKSKSDGAKPEVSEDDKHNATFCMPSL